MKLTELFTANFVRAWVGPGCQRPSPVPMVSLGIEIYPGDGRITLLSMTHEQVDRLVAELQKAKAPTAPEKTE
jgi:hypothetical protein